MDSKRQLSNYNASTQLYMSLVQILQAWQLSQVDSVLTSSESAPRDLTLTVWISLWWAQMIFPLLSMEATGSSRPILIRAVPSSYPRATLHHHLLRHKAAYDTQIKLGVWNTTAD